VLAVEDDGALSRIVARQLTELGYHVLEAESAVAALAFLEKQPVDLLFTDVIMPGELSGLQLVRFASSRWPNLRVVLTSGFPGAKLGGSVGTTTTRLLSKPYRRRISLASFVRRSRLNRQYRRRRPGSQPIARRP
jgi:CheY-like chemotaxis protein